MNTASPQWNEEELTYVEEELAEEYPSLAAAIIREVVRATQPTVNPDDGRYRFLSAVRRNLPR